MKNKFTFGSDPELMLHDLHLNKIVNAIPVIKHDKHDPVKLGDGIEFYSDNVLTEVRFPASDDKVGFIGWLRKSFQKAQEFLGDRYALVPQASHVYDIDELGPKPKVMFGKLPEPWEIGCNPSFDAYAEDVRVPAPFKDGLRSGSFHLHLGNADFVKGEGKLLDMPSKVQAIKLLDSLVGVPSILINQDETSLARRMLYGKAGEFRPTPYGIEWRVLDNYALRSPQLVELIFDLVQHALVVIDQDAEREVLDTTDLRLVRSAIDTNNKVLADMAMRRSGLSNALMKRVNDMAKYEPDFEKEWALS